MGTESLTLKWGTVKAWEVNEGSPASEALGRWLSGGVSYSAMAQRNTDEQKVAICDAIDAVDGEIWNDWDGVIMSREDAKKYIMEYRR